MARHHPAAPRGGARADLRRRHRPRDRGNGRPHRHVRRPTRRRPAPERLLPLPPHRRGNGRLGRARRRHGRGDRSPGPRGAAAGADVRTSAEAGASPRTARSTGLGAPRAAGGACGVRAQRCSTDCWGQQARSPSPRRRIPRAPSSRSTCCSPGCPASSTRPPTRRLPSPGTFHINEGYQQLQEAYAAASAGRVPTSRRARSTATASPTGRSSDRSSLPAARRPSRCSGCTCLRGCSARTTTRCATSRSAATLESLNSVLAEPIRGRADARPRVAATASRRRRPSSSSATSGCRVATSSTARCSGPGPSRRTRSAPGGGDPTSGSSLRARGRAAVVACPESRGTTRHRRHSRPDPSLHPLPVRGIAERYSAREYPEPARHPGPNGRDTRRNRTDKTPRGHVTAAKQN